MASAERVEAESQAGGAPASGELLEDVRTFVERFVVLTPEQLDCVALWILHTHAVGAAAQTPYLSIRSPEKQSGKTRLLEILELLCARAKLWTRPSEAVTFRTIERDQPTLLLDEIDTIWTDKGNEHEGLRALLNSGNRRGTTVPRCVGPSQALHEFPVSCAKALAGIGAPPDTVADRSIPIGLKRRRVTRRSSASGSATRHGLSRGRRSASGWQSGPRRTRRSSRIAGPTCPRSSRTVSRTRPNRF
ncbi:MAG: hypothetical protein M3515_04285 [Actinomycetota bacterium]|nr:hypothetical protein [Actinomycetota bacterium]